MKRFIFCIFSFLLFFNTILFAQSITWEKAYIQPDQQNFNSIVQTEDDGYIATGHSRINSYDYLYIVRLNKYGDTIWTKSINGFDGSCIIKTIDNNYAISTSGGEFIKIDINGNIIIRGTHYDISSRILKILQTPDGNYYMCGRYFPAAEYPELIKYDVNGNLLWDSVYYSGFYFGDFRDMILYNNNFILTGNNMQAVTFQIYFFIMSIDQNGERNWLSRIDSSFTIAPRKITLANNNLLVSGINRNNNACLAKFTIMGEYIWIKGYDTNYLGDLRSVIISNDGNYISTGYLFNSTSDRLSIMKTDTNGIIIWQKFYGYNNSYTTPWDLKQTNDTGFVIAGTTNFQLQDCYVLKTDKNGFVEPIGIIKQEQNIPQNYKLFQNYPNPFNPMTCIEYEIPNDANIKLTVYDITGREILSINEYRQADVYTYTFDGTNLASGIYIYKIDASTPLSTYTETRKMVLIK